MHIEPTEKSYRRFVERGVAGPVTMLNLLRYREQADYTRSPELAPDQPVTGEQAYQTYVERTGPLLEEVGGRVRFMGHGGPTLIGPEDERWDLVLLVEYPDVEAFNRMTTNPRYLAGVGHRTAALADSRLLPISG